MTDPSFDPQIPEVIRPLLQDYLSLTDIALPGRLNGFYLEGSIALEEFDPRLSDIDFVAVLASLPAPGDFKLLRDVHQVIARQHPTMKLEGMYFGPDDLGRVDQDFSPFIVYHDGKLKWSTSFDLSLITWWILKHHGIGISGPPRHAISYRVDTDVLIRLQHRNLNAYWSTWITRPNKLLMLLSDWGIEWTVLGVLRQFYTFRERQITSKIKAGEYALACLPERWHRIIREAIRMRQFPRQSLYTSRLKRAREAYAFLKYLISECNLLFDSK